MTDSSTNLAFGDNATLETNLSEFAKFIEESDSDLADVLSAHLNDLDNEDFSPDCIWDALDANISADENQEELSGASGDATASTNQSAASVNQSPTVSGWLLEGVTIEGFRGVNNATQPLEIKFKPNSINSISAVNGVGKTSVYDAIRFAIEGKLDWLESLPSAEDAKAYYQNRFHPTGISKIELNLLAEPSGQKCRILVERQPDGTRVVSANSPWNGEAILASLKREFVFLDGPTFQEFISATPLSRGRTFSGLLGLSAYSRIRWSLAKLSNTAGFNNYFKRNEHQQSIARAKQLADSALSGIAADFEVVVGKDFQSTSLAETKTACLDALAQIGPLKDICEGNSFDELDIDVCVQAIKESEGGEKRERLRECIAERAKLEKKQSELPDEPKLLELGELAATRDQAISETAGSLFLNLYKAGAEVVSQDDWSENDGCPLCEEKLNKDLADHLEMRLSQFAELNQATEAISNAWTNAGWENLIQLEDILESDPSKRILSSIQKTAVEGLLSESHIKELTSRFAILKTTLAEQTKSLLEEQSNLEAELPPSAVEATKKVEAARRLKEHLSSYDAQSAKAAQATARVDQIDRLKSFLDAAGSAFSFAEADLSRSRLASVEPVFKAYFAKMWFHGVEPGVSKKSGSENLRIKLDKFHGLADISPQAVLSESSRNAFAISLYLAAASLFGGLPRFVILDDVTSSFDAGHQLQLVELIRTKFARPSNANGPQVILLSHDTALEKLFNKHSSSTEWHHQRLEGTPQVAVFPQTGAVNKVKTYTISKLQAGQADLAKDGVRQYLEYRLSDLISKLRIPVPVDIAFNDSKQLSSEFLNAIDAAVKLHKAAGSLVLTSAQQADLNLNMATIVGNFLSHWGTGQVLSFTANALLGVMQSIDEYCDCFTFQPTPGGALRYYKSLSQIQ